LIPLFFALMRKNSIGIFDSGYGGLTVFKSIIPELPAYDYIYFGDNARAPYGDHSYETVYRYTLDCVEWLFAQGCSLVILACNTASAKALRSIQQNILPNKYPGKRVLGVIRPTAEVINQYTTSNKVGVFGTRGTVKSASYQIEINKLYPEIEVVQQSCPMWVPLIENNEHLNAGADYFVKIYLERLLAKAENIDCILLACTHYPLIVPKLEAYLPAGIKLLSQGDIVAQSLKDYLSRHPEIEAELRHGGGQTFVTTGDPEVFNTLGSLFFGSSIKSTAVSCPAL
jgi:glutamate racemase